VGLDQVPDIEQREGPRGTLNDPAILDPFQKYSLVMAAGECRFFQMKLPQQWYWKLSVTVDNRQAGPRGKLRIRILPTNPPWSPLAFFKNEKIFELGRESIQGVIGVGNKDSTRIAILQLCQEGPPLRVTLESQVANVSEMMSPPKKDDDQEE
jgi:hypothetical protein